MIDSFILRIKRRETPFFRFLHALAKRLSTTNLPLPRFFHPLLRALYHGHQSFFSFLRRVVALFYVEPLFRGRCESIGARFTIHRMPFVVGHAKIYIGNDVCFFGKVDIFSGRIFDEPKLVIHDRVDLGHNTLFLLNKEIVIEEDVNIASNVSFMDTDAHPRDAEARSADLPPNPEEIKPIRVCKNAWIGHRCFIMKGVTIGEGAIIGVDSVVITDIPPYSIAMGNPARVVVKDMKGKVQSQRQE